jgi:phage terminase large subunit-like protein
MTYRGDDDIPDPQRLIKLARQSMSSAERRRKYRKIEYLDAGFWYRPQLEFFAAGASGVHQRLIYGGNQTGKTLACGAEVSWHLTGLYPDWWTGHRFAKPIRAWAVGESVILVRDTLQRQLCGQEFGEGLVPLESFAKKPIMVAGGMRACDTIFVTHHTGGKIDGVSSLSFKTFEQRRERLQSESVDLIWIDERPDELIYSELLARTAATSGHLMVSFTPVGEGAGGGVTYKFLSESSADRSPHHIHGEEAKHISPERREVLEVEFSDAERETRLEGTPQLGSGPVFPIELLSSLIKPTDRERLRDTMPENRWCVGIDFGFDHPFAAVMICWEPESNQIWVVDSFRMQRSSALYHAQRIFGMCWNLRLPIAYPHDAHTHDKGSGETLASQYKALGLRMMATNAFNHGTNHNYSVDPALEEIRSYMYGGRLHIGSYNHEFIDEVRNYHRDQDFRLVKQRDDLVSAFRYAVMMRRFGKPLHECEGYGYTKLPFAVGQPRGGGQRFARGSVNHPDGSFDVFTGKMG